MGYTSDLAAFVADLAWDDLPETLIEKAKAHILDTLGVALGGSLTDHVRQTARVIESLGGTPECTAIGQTFRTNALEAAFLGGTCAHSIEFDDTGQWAHTGSGVVPAAVSLGEARHIDGKTLILAVVAGYELTSRAAAAAGFKHRARGYHPTGACGVFGAAAVGSKILGLDADRIVAAFGTAATHASGITQYRCDGGPTKHIHPGIAGRAGLLSALMAHAGFAGTADTLEGKYGFLNVLADGGEHLEQLTANLGTEFGLTTTDIRPYPCCRQVHAPADLVLAMVHEHGVAPKNIEKIELFLPAYSMQQGWLLDTAPPASKLNAILSMPYCLAAAFIDGELTLRQFEDKRVRDPEVHALARKISFTKDPELSALYPVHRGARLEVALKSGSVPPLTIADPRGSIENPIPFADVVAKFRDLAAPVLAADALDAVQDRIERLETLKDVGEFVSLLAAKNATALKSAG